MFCCKICSNDGPLTDWKGRTVYSTNQETVRHHGPSNHRQAPSSPSARSRKAVQWMKGPAAGEEELREHFRPEFLNRIDESLLPCLGRGREHIKRIIDITDRRRPTPGRSEDPPRHATARPRSAGGATATIRRPGARGR